MRLSQRLIALLERANETLDRIDRRLERRERKPKPPEFPFDFDRHLESTKAALAQLPPPRATRRQS